jgi:hypothetical protein
VRSLGRAVISSEPRSRRTRAPHPTHIGDHTAPHIEAHPAPGAAIGTGVLRTEWNALEVGDRVLVHDPDDPEHTLVPGVVTAVDQTAGSNTVEFKLRAQGSASRSIRPARLTVHADPVDFDETCWRCDRPRH